MKRLTKLLFSLLSALFALGLLGAVAAGGAYVYLAPNLPSTESLQDMQFQVPLRIFAADGSLIAEFGEKRRIPLSYAEIPEPMIQAVLAAEDDRFFHHPGVDYQGILRAAWHLLRTGEKGQGGSTITMQVARNFFLSREKTFLRKFNEILLALKIERELGKQEILELYLNKIYLGNRAYGVGAAAQVYYGRPLAELSLAEYAMIAGLPKAPSRYNPIADPERALTRRNYVLGRMRSLDFIEPDAYQAALATPNTARYHGQEVEADAPYLAEMIRTEMVARYGDAAYTDGYRVTTTIDSRLQNSANHALVSALLEYDRRHGWRGPEARTDPADPEAGLQRLRDTPVTGGQIPALVMGVEERSARVRLADGTDVEIPWEGLEWARAYRSDNATGPAPKRAGDVLAPGDLVRIRPSGEEQWALSQLPQVEGALVALNPDTGAILSLVGGFDFNRSKFNRVTQAERQPGSNFKPFIYSAALEKGFTPASIINDAPVVYEDAGAEKLWRPENYSGRFFGPTRLREALYKSRNLVSIRLLREIGIEYAVDYVQRFGFRPDSLPRNLTLALGTGVLTPLELVGGYAVFANGGFRVEPHALARIENTRGEVLFEARPATVCRDCPEPGLPGALPLLPVGRTASGDEPPVVATRVLTPQNSWLITSLLQDVIKRGTGRRALELGRGDIGGKTGTTNDQLDAWFSGFNADIVTTCWVGFDQPRSLGSRETGGRAALPMWIQFMGEALKGRPEHVQPEPEGLVTVRIDPDTGLLARGDQPDAIFETFREDTVPHQTAVAPLGTGSGGGSAPERLF
jgi:penicillin-binding protein 1A